MLKDLGDESGAAVGEDLSVFVISADHYFFMTLGIAVEPTYREASFGDLDLLARDFHNLGVDDDHVVFGDGLRVDLFAVFFYGKGFARDDKDAE